MSAATLPILLRSLGLTTMAREHALPQNYCYRRRGVAS
jgi:hypothetical protein